jgi:hypothetical protein
VEQEHRRQGGRGAGRERQVGVDPDPVERGDLAAALRERGDADRLGVWLGTPTLPITIRPGSPAVAGVTLTGIGGDVRLTADPG